ncbi:MAG: DNA primase [Deltaproteobacteria bacterium]|nr:DNA primase [Deltaproteobacteria bacterium]
MPHYSPQTIERVRTAVDLLDLIQHHVDLHRSGPDRYTGLCPFHTEKTPSFSVSPGKGFFYCFGCKAGGDSFRFMQLMYSMSFPEAVRELASRYGIDLPEEDGPDDGPGVSRERRRRLLEAAQAAGDLFHEYLLSPDGKRVRNYLRSRGVTDRVVRSFRLGYCPPSSHWLSRQLLSMGFEEDVLVDAGLAKPGQFGGIYDLFRNRVMVPIQERGPRDGSGDPAGSVVAFGGRLVDVPGIRPEPPREADGQAPRENPKYINSPTTPINSKGKLLYGLPQAEPFLEAAGCVFIVEGYFDLIALHSAGIQYSVAAMGTSLTQTQVNLLRGSDLLVYLLFDGDPPGRDAALKAIPKLLNAGLNGRAVILPEDRDPDAFIRRHGPEELMRLAEEAETMEDYACRRILEANDGSLAGNVNKTKDAKLLLREVNDPASAAILRNIIAEGIGISPEDLLEGGASGPGDPQETPGAQRSPAPADFRFSWGDPEGQGELEPRSAKLLRLVLSRPSLTPRLERLSGRWPEEISESVAGELLAQYRETGTVELMRLPDRFRDGPVGEIVAMAANSPGPDGGGEDEQLLEIFTGQVLEIWCKASLESLKDELSLAVSSGDEKKKAEIISRRTALQDEYERCRQDGDRQPLNAAPGRLRA